MLPPSARGGCSSWPKRSTGRNPEALELYMRLEAARGEVEELRGRIAVNRLEPPGHKSDPSAAWDVREHPGRGRQTPRSRKSPPPEKGSR